MTSRRTLEELARYARSELEQVFGGGVEPDPSGLVGWEFRGYNIPLLTQVLGFRKFRKGFYAADGQVWGYNIPVTQGGLSAPWDCRPSNETPRRFGFYLVRPSSDTSDGVRYPHAVMLDYGEGRNGLFEGSFLRDYVRQVDGDNPDLLLGKACTAVGSNHILPMFFIIQRDRQSPGEVVHRG